MGSTKGMSMPINAAMNATNRLAVDGEVTFNYAAWNEMRALPGSNRAIDEITVECR